MKKSMLLIIAILFTFTLTGCGFNTEDDNLSDKTIICTSDQNLIDNVCVDKESNDETPVCINYQTLIDNICVDDETIVDDRLLRTRISIHEETIFKAGSFIVSYNTIFDAGLNSLEDKYLFTYDLENKVIISTKEDADNYYSLSYLDDDGTWYNIKNYQDENIRLYSSYSDEKFSDIMFTNYIFSEFSDSNLTENGDGVYEITINYTDVSEYYDSFQANFGVIESTFFDVYNPIDSAVIDVTLTYNETERVFDNILLTFIDEEDVSINNVTKWTLLIELSSIGLDVTADLTYDYTDDYASYSNENYDRLSLYQVNSSFVGVLSHSYDIDMVKLTIDNTGTYTISTIGYISGTISLRILDLEGNILFSKNITSSLDSFTYDFDEGEYIVYVVLVEILDIINTEDSFSVTIED